MTSCDLLAQGLAVVVAVREFAIVRCDDELSWRRPVDSRAVAVAPKKNVENVVIA